LSHEDKVHRGSRYKVGRAAAVLLTGPEVDELWKLAEAEGYTKLANWIAAQLRKLIPEESRLKPKVVKHVERSWKDLTTEEKLVLSEKWSKVKPMPAALPKWSVANKLAWLDRNWPVDQPVPEPPKAEEERAEGMDLF